ncbi:MAG: DNA-binding protein [Candidatus Nanoarchaeia archaeon]|nr:DNA-binding protein [Candidatus Nanoarchaeia archaeon]
MMNITFNELRKIKDNLPSGSIGQIAKILNISEDTVRNYFGGEHYKTGECVGIHFEQGPEGGIVSLDNTEVLNLALKMINSN